METVIGFIAGYLAGSREGREGAERLRSSWAAIRTSPEVHRLAAEGLSVAEALTRRASARSLGAVGAGVARTLAGRVAGGQQREREAPAA